MFFNPIETHKYEILHQLMELQLMLTNMDFDMKIS